LKGRGNYSYGIEAQGDMYGTFARKFKIKTLGYSIHLESMNQQVK
jgi:hypothetical protein